MLLRELLSLSRMCLLQQVQNQRLTLLVLVTLLQIRVVQGPLACSPAGGMRPFGMNGGGSMGMMGGGPVMMGNGRGGGGMGGVGGFGGGMGNGSLGMGMGMGGMMSGSGSLSLSSGMDSGMGMGNGMGMGMRLSSGMGDMGPIPSGDRQRSPPPKKRHSSRYVA